jgi:hypothetical protein
MFSASQLDRLPERGVRQLLSVDVDHNGQPRFEDSHGAFMYGPAGQDGGMRYDENGRGIVEDPVYGFWVDQGHGVVVS